MGFWQWVGRLARVPDTATHRFDAETEPMPIDQLFIELASKVRVDRTRALSVGSVLKGRNVLCSLATLPIQELDLENRPQRSPLLEQTDPNVANVVHMAQTVEDLVFDAVSWWRVTARAADGYPTAARHLDVNTVSVNPPGGRNPAPLPSGFDPRAGVVYVDGHPVSGRDVIRFDSPNPPVLVAGLSTIQRAILLDLTAKMYAEDPQAREYFSARDGIDPEDDEEIARFIADYAAARRKRSIAYVPAQYQHETATGVSPAEMQLVELQRQANLDIANMLGLDPEDVGVSTTSRTYTNAVDRRRDRINDVLAPYMRAITDRLSMGDVTRRGRRVVFNLDDYMKSNPTERWAVYSQAHQMGALEVEEIRNFESWPPLPPGAESDDAGTGGQSDAATVTPLPVAASRRATHQFDNDGPITFTFDGSAGHTFSVNTESRTITGLAVPYGVVGMKYGLKFRFTRGSLKYADVGRVKHYMDHVTPVGKALELTDTPAGLTAKLSVSAGPEGDRLLQLAQDGVYDGLSVGVEFDIDPEQGDVRLAQDGVYDVLRSDLREITSTPMPQFDDARMTKVAASLTGGNHPMTAPITGQNPAAPAGAPALPQQQPAPAPAPTPSPIAFTADMAAALQALAANLVTPAPAPVAPVAPVAPTDGPTIVNPTFNAPTHVNEPQPYRFDRKGNLQAGTHDFSRDLVAAAQGDTAARDRATSFVRAQFDVATGDINELNPTRQRPDMYVDQRSFRYPVWEAVSKGTLTDITPFTFPKFNSASGLVANHTEGVEPSSGTFTTTGQTVTPTAVSGKAKITREVWDQGGNPQISALIWRQMEKAWYEALEAFAVATLDAATPTQITLTTAAVDDALVDELEAAFVALQFIRGGFSMDTAFGQVDLYKRLAAAEDTTGRPLLPALGPMNTNGTVRGRWSGLDMNGVSILPAWALAASGTVAASSYLFDREVVHGWASAPQRLDFNIEVAHVYIGLWGYKAGAISDIAGVREIIYDPTA